jgi:transglutaminase-like putative cysteine protease
MTDCDAIASADNTTLQIEDACDAESVDSNTLLTDDEGISFDDVKNQTEIISDKNTTYYGGTYSVTLKDVNSSQAISNKTVNFIINNVNYTAVSDTDGVASVNLSLNPGKYSVVAYFEGDDTYMASDNFTSVVEVLATVRACDITKYYKGSTQFSATFYDSQGNFLENRKVVITVNGKSYTAKTNGKGVAFLSMDFQPGTYKVVSTDPITGYALSTTFRILSTISAADTSKVIGDGRKFTAKFYRNNGKALANTNVKFKLNGKTYTVKTDSNGVASLSLKNLKKGTYKVICYNTDGLSKTCTIKVYNKVSTKFITTQYTFQKKGSRTIKVKLATGMGYAPTSGKVVKITVNKKTYSKKTNAKGEVSLKLPSLKKGIHTIKYKFMGTSHYKASGASSKVSVITTRNAALTVKSSTTFGHGAKTPFKVAVTAGGVAVTNKAVTFDVKGKSHVRYTDANGIASLPIELAVGNYHVKYSISKDSNVDGKSGSKDITVKNRVNSTLTWKSGTSFKDSGQTFKVLLKDAKGKPLSGQTVKLKIHSKTYSATTSSEGYAKFKVNAPVGKYDVNVNFEGSNSFNPTSTSKSVSITFSSYTKGVNEKNTIKDLSAYLKSSKNCQVGNSKIKSLVKSLTSGLTSDYDKAKAIFNYVRDTLSYSFYYNTKYGATGTLSAKKGNCVDHSHLLVAMYRTAGLAARYVHGDCKFTSGSTYGHVWAQVLIGDDWVCADATSSRNSLGKIANWNTKSYSLEGRYVNLQF